MKICIASGKGGTGKTTVAVNLAYTLALSGKRVRLLDCDVEAPNDHLFVQSNIAQRRPVEVLKPALETKKCSGCGRCAAACAYNAILATKEKVLFFPELCHACGLCAFICPEGAITEQPHTIGSVQSGTNETQFPEAPFTFAYGILDIGEVAAPAVVRRVKQLVDPLGITLIDASPGTGCSVVEAIRNTDAALLVTEPTAFGLNDLKLAVHLCLKLGILPGIVVNRSDGKDRIIADYASRTKVPIVGRIPFRRKYAESYSRGKLLAKIYPELQKRLLGIYASVCRLSRITLPAVPAIESFSTPGGSLGSVEYGSATSQSELAIISGKGGTGKTTIAACLSFLAGNKVLVDNDVDAPDLPLLLDPSVVEAHLFIGGKTYRIDPAKCTACGLCAKACHFDAINPDSSLKASHGEAYRIDPFICEGCGLCRHICPGGAISAYDNTTGNWYVSYTPRGPLVHARLGIGEENSGRLVTQVRKKAAELAAEFRLDKILSDGPPGTGCPVIASISGVDGVVIVTEPTVSGIHDLKRVLQLTRHFRVPSYLVINKADLNIEQIRKIETIAGEAEVRVIGRIPFDRAVENALREGKTIVEYDSGPAAGAIRTLWDNLKKEIKIGRFQGDGTALNVRF